MQVEGTKLIFIMNLSVPDFLKFASRMPQIAQIKLVLTCKIFPGSGKGVGGGGACPWTLWKLSFFFFR